MLKRIGTLAQALLLALLASPLGASVAAAQTTMEAQPIARGLHYQVERDYRKCMSPFCGGYWVNAVNRRATRCIDGTLADRCYVVDIDWSRIGLKSSQLDETGRLIVLGRIVPWNEDHPFDVALGELRAAAAWHAATDAAPTGSFYRVQDLGFVCVAYPCFNKRANLLNRRGRTTISGLDLRDVEATEAQLEAANRALQAGRLLVAGDITRDPLPRPNVPAGRTLTASQFYLPIEPVECVVDSDCTVSTYHSPVTSPDECYCTLCPEVISADDAESNEASWHAYCDDVRLICPLVRCVLPPPVGCVKNQCEYLPERIEISALE